MYIYIKTVSRTSSSVYVYNIYIYICRGASDQPNGCTELHLCAQTSVLNKSRVCASFPPKRSFIR